jgi:hypothetical protein
LIVVLSCFQPQTNIRVDRFMSAPVCQALLEPSSRKQ